ncbi:hemolysin type calcium-binding protein [Stackebrandtia endophytica]|uniref:Hemolysin type calcium-binding protein n=1 Tax=Stackebrandtia endophytica TaxID=1496996 RepID=A0A543B096_9ACTN|nr:M91 family zinc metallopeptidase [Stackebrandtia endophytica]TQL78244.1 hemolysin type calcium-binding protein [Stackebrandtia endophytica]
MTEPPINVDMKWFDLNADPGAIDKAATAWTDLGEVGSTAAEDLQTAAGKVYDDPWKGDTRDSYEIHQKALRDSTDGFTAAAGPVKDALTTIASSLRTAQGKLDTTKSTVVNAVACTVTETQLKFRPKTPEESQQVLDAVDAAKEIRQDLDTALSEQTTALQTAKSDWTALSNDWEDIANGGVLDAFPDMPAAPDDGGVITLPDGTVVVNTGESDDDVSVVTQPDGTVIVTVNGTPTTYPPGTDIVLRTGSGNDTVALTGDTAVTVVAGDGNDAVNADGLFPLMPGPETNQTILGGSGNDTVALGSGDNRVSTGGGNDSVTLGGGDNHVATGDGNDSVDTGSFLNPNGRDGDNIVSTGRGDDTVTTGRGDDRVYTGSGNDSIRDHGGDNVVDAGGGNDTIEVGDGDDTIYGGSGSDSIDTARGGNNSVSGGDGDDTIYGSQNGDDEIYAGAGDDFVNGINGDNHIDGGSGDDILYGGRGDDVIHGGDGDDVMYGGHGDDHVDGGEGTDAAYIQDGSDTTSDENEATEHVDIADTDFINIDGSDHFTTRTQADLDLIAASPSGTQLVDALHENRDPNFWAGNNELTITETTDQNGYATQNKNLWGNHDSAINYNPTFEHAGGKPVNVLYHEMAHVHSYWNGNIDRSEYTGGDDWRNDDDGNPEPVPNSERQATGLPIDHDGDGDYEIDPEQPFHLTDNGLRREMGLPERQQYGRPNP